MVTLTIILLSTIYRRNIKLTGILRHVSRILQTTIKINRSCFENADVIYSQSHMAERRSTEKNTRHTSGNSMGTKTDQSSYKPVLNELIRTIITITKSTKELKQRLRRPEYGRLESNRSRLAKQQLCTCITLFCTIF